MSDYGGVDLYSVLELDVTASAADVRAAYRRLAIAWHPDKHPPESRERATSMFQLVAQVRNS